MTPERVECLDAMSYGHANGLANWNPADAWPWGIGVLVRAEEGCGDEWAKGVGEIVGPSKEWLQHHPNPRAQVRSMTGPLHHPDLPIRKRNPFQ